MTRENVKMNMDIISAFAEGRIIQYKTITDVWCDLTEEEGLPMGTLEEEPNNFRIKPDPKYRPFKNPKECWDEMLKHKPFGITVSTNECNYSAFKSLCDDGCDFFGYENETFESAFVDIQFADGTPFGVKVEG